MVNGSEVVHSLFTIDHSLIQIGDFAHRSDDVLKIGKRQPLEIFRIRHRHIRAGNTFDGCVEIIKSALNNLCANLCANTAKWMRLFGNYHAVSFLDGFYDGIDVERPNGAWIDYFA